jgi:hypothetical protein
LKIGTQKDNMHDRWEKWHAKEAINPTVCVIPFCIGGEALVLLSSRGRHKMTDKAALRSWLTGRLVTVPEPPGTWGKPKVPEKHFNIHMRHSDGSIILTSARSVDREVSAFAEDIILGLRLSPLHVEDIHAG